MAKLVKLCFIRRSFFEIHSDYIKILDVGSPQKQSQRTHLCVVIEKDDNHFFIPLDWIIYSNSTFSFSRFCSI